MIVLHLLQLYSVKSQGDAAMSTGVKSSQYSTDIYIFLNCGPFLLDARLRLRASLSGQMPIVWCQYKRNIRQGSLNMNLIINVIILQTVYPEKQHRMPYWSQHCT